MSTGNYPRISSIIPPIIILCSGFPGVSQVQSPQGCLWVVLETRNFGGTFRKTNDLWKHLHHRSLYRLNVQRNFGENVILRCKSQNKCWNSSIKTILWQTYLYITSLFINTSGLSVKTGVIGMKRTRSINEMSLPQIIF